MIAVLVIEIVITLMDFVEEDMSRKLPASERINHTLLAINYGAILMLLLPVLIGWAMQPTGVKSAYTGWLSIVAAAAAVGAALCGMRDFAAARRLGAHDQRACREPRRQNCRGGRPSSSPAPPVSSAAGWLQRSPAAAIRSSRWCAIPRRPRCFRRRSR